MLGFATAPREESAAYIKDWLAEFRKEPTYLFDILTDVNRAARMISERLACEVADLRDTWVTDTFDMTHQLIGHVHVLLRQVVFMVVKRIYRQQRFSVVPIFGLGLLHIADNESAAAQRSRRGLDKKFL